jgi:hypothetical protein
MSELIAQSLAHHRLNKFYFERWQRDNRVEAPKVIAYLDGGGRPTDSAVTTHYGRALVLAEDARRKLGATPVPGPVPGDKLAFSPPPLSNPVTIQVTNANKQLTLDPAKDYILEVVEKLTNAPGLWIMGGRNVHLIGGHVAMEAPGGGNAYAEHTAVKIRDVDFYAPKAGHVFVEGLLIDGAHTCDGIVTACSLKTVTIQNCRVTVRPRPATLPGIHEDCIQIQGAVGPLRIDKLTGYTVLQGIFIQAHDGQNVGPIDIRRMNTHGAYHSIYQANDSKTGAALTSVIKLTDYHISDSHPQKVFGLDVFPQSDGNGSPGRRAVVSPDGKYLTFEGPYAMSGRIENGGPPGGDFVPAGVAGLGYISPGYA